MRKRLNYANVIATLALFFALSGGALAAKHYLVNSTKQINPKVLKALKGKVGETGPRGSQGLSGKEGAPGKEGALGKEGSPGSALAYAHVRANGELDTALSKNILSSNVSKPSEGVYCFNSLSFTPHNAVATIDWQSTKNGVIEEITVALGAGAESLCEKPTQVGVLTASVEPKGFTAGLGRAFYITIN